MLNAIRNIQKDIIMKRFTQEKQSIAQGRAAANSCVSSAYALSRGLLCDEVSFHKSDILDFFLIFEV